MIRAWIERIFGSIVDAPQEASYRAGLERVASVQTAKDTAIQAKTYDSPIWDFAKTLGPSQKPRARFSWPSDRWNMSEAEKVRVIKLFKNAGWPRWPEMGHD